MGKQKVLWIGMGSVGQRHARNIRELFGDNIVLSAYRERGLDHVITPDLEIKKGASLKSEYGLTEYFDMTAAFESEPDIVFITNPNSLHMKFALEAAKNGCHLFIEKPLSHTLEGVRELKALVAENRLVALVGYQLRFHPGYSKLRGLLAERVVGRVTSVQHRFGEYLPNWHKYEDYRRYHAARADQGGGVLLSQSHDLDFLFGLFGMPARIFALGGRRGELELDVEDTADVMMEMKSDSGPFAIHVHQDYLQDPPVRKSEIVGTHGRIVWDYYACKLELFRLGQETPEIFGFGCLERNKMFRDELLHFFECVKTGSKPVVGLDDAEASLRMALAAKASIEKGCVIEL